MSTSMYRALTTLYERAKDGMTVDELETVANLVELAGDEARRLSAVCEDIACLVSSDEGASPGTGCFTADGGLFDLLCSLAHGLDTIGGMVEIGRDAVYQARKRLAGEEAQP